ELAEHPQAVALDAQLLPLLDAVRTRAGGALALISGRAIADLDRLFGRRDFAVAGQHGSERRDARGALHVADVALVRLAEVRAGLERLVERHPGLMLEDKGATLALHYLKAPQLGRELRAEVARLAAPLVPSFTLLDGHAVIEVKPALYTKESAVGAFMR